MASLLIVPFYSLHPRTVPEATIFPHPGTDPRAYLHKVPDDHQKAEMPMIQVWKHLLSLEALAGDPGWERFSDTLLKAWQY
jgi:hypothetical protein